MRLVRLLSVLATCLMLAACGKPSETGNALPAVQGSTPAPAPAATASKPGRPLALTLEAAGSKMHAGRLNLVLTFNQRLAGAQNFDKLLRLNDNKGAPRRRWLGAG